MIATRFLTACAAAALGLSTALAQTDRPVPRAADDVALARRALEQIHPGYDRYTDRPALDRAFDALQQDAAAGMSERELFLRLSAITALIRCGHTKIEPTKAWEESRQTTPTYLPLRFRAGPQGMVVTDSGDAGVRPGDRVLSIDGRPAPEVLGRLWGLVPSDGWTDECRWFALGGSSDLDACEFDLFYAAAYAPGPTLELEVLSPGAGSSRLVRVPAMTRQGRDAAIGSTPPPQNLDEAVSLQIVGDAAVLRVDTFVAYRKQIRPADIYRPFFEKIRQAGCRTLILDLRQNSGGSDSAAEDLFGFLIDQPMAQEGKGWVKTFRFGDLADKLETWDRSMLSLPEEAFDKLDNGFYQLKSQGRVVQPQQPGFSGRVIALCGPANQSGATIFLAALREKRGATLVGEPTGGSVEGPTAGIIFFLPLPESGLRVRIPAVRGVTGLKAGLPGRGIDPDVTVNAPALPPADATLEKALELAGARTP